MAANLTICALLAGLVLIILLKLYVQAVMEEGFQASPPPSQQQLSFCPLKTSPFTNATGDTVCCDGKVQGNACQGSPVCALSNRSTVPSCTQMLQDYYNVQSKKVCPSTMPNYYENEQGVAVGCTASDLDATMTRPLVPSQPHCTIYADQGDNFAKQDSCYNQNALASAQCFGIGCTKALSPQSNVGMNLVTIEFGDTAGHRHTCYTQDSYAAYLNKVKPNWQTTFDISKSIKICDVAKAVFVDRTMEANETQS